ncbi:MAG: EAL domain-containing protein [Lachnospiraceae bacterium]|nr:EAL domain-containing protein [Lachnospiraceae bacterium]
MDNFLKVKYFDDLFDIFSSQKEGWYAFYADYSHSLVHWSQELVDFLGLPSRIMDEKEALGLYVSLIHPDDYQSYMAAVKKMFDGENDGLEISYRIRTKKGEYATVGTYSKFKRDEDGNPAFFAGSVIDYQRHDYVDPTTGLYTAKHMIENMDMLSDEGKSYFLLLFNIRDFSSVNNKYGYIVGNRVLRYISNVLMNCRNGAMVFKLEGTKFALLKSFEPGDDSIEHYGVSEFNNIKNLISNGIQIENIKIYIDIYGGAVYTDEAGISSHTIYTSALFALSKAYEDTNLDSLNIFNQSWLFDERRKLSLYEAIRDSIKEHCKGFYLAYQPIIGKESRKLVSMEALLRWYGDDYGEVFPGAYIEWLEKDPVFYDLGTWIMRQALEDAKKIIKILPDFIVNINIAYPQLGRDDFESTLEKVVSESGVAPKNIRLELTERCKLLDEKLLIRRMNFIQKLGIQTSLDDFGTGYSAINLLFDLPTDQIKIDRAFINNIENEEPKRIMLKAIIDCARIIGAHVCVEGIETAEMADYICDNFNITSLQGYYYSKPIALDKFMENMNKWM